MRNQIFVQDETPKPSKSKKTKKIAKPRKLFNKLETNQQPKFNAYTNTSTSNVNQ